VIARRSQYFTLSPGLPSGFRTRKSVSASQSAKPFQPSQVFLLKPQVFPLSPSSFSQAIEANLLPVNHGRDLLK
jgi:hypothetical protein